MNKSKTAERNILSLGYTIEWCISPRGNKLCKAIKEGEKDIYATNLIALEKAIFTHQIKINQTTIKFSLLSNYRTYGIELRERNYPRFEGRYNAYMAIYGQLSETYLGTIESPMAMDITPDDLPQLLEDAEIYIRGNTAAFSIWG